MDDVIAGERNVGGVLIRPLPYRKVKKRRIYYHPGMGDPTCPLPADAYHTRLLLRMGFTLEPPIKVEQIIPPPIVIPQLKAAESDDGGQVTPVVIPQQVEDYNKLAEWAKKEGIPFRNLTIKPEQVAEIPFGSNILGSKKED